MAAGCRPNQISLELTDPPWEAFDPLPGSFRLLVDPLLENREFTLCGTLFGLLRVEEPPDILSAGLKLSCSYKTRTECQLAMLLG